MGKQSKEAPGLTIQYWRTGLYTNRSQLFAPLRAIGIQIVQMRDALIDGQDMEVTDHLEVQRRYGFSRYCSQQLAANEIPNQFYSQRTSTGSVFPLMDSNQRFAKFSTSAVTTLWTKASNDQAFPLMVADQLYICNGTTNGQKRYDTTGAALHSMGIAAPVAAPLLAPQTAAGSTFWQPNITYGAAAHTLLDPNGNIQQARLGGAGTTGPNPPLWSPQYNTVTAEVSPGTLTWLNLGPIGVWTANLAISASFYIVDSNGNFQQLTTNGTTGATPPAWNAALGGTTNDNTAVWTNRGNGTASVFSGYIYVYVYSTQAPTVTTGYYHCSTASPETFITGTVFGPYSYVLSGAYSTNTDVGSVDIYRIRDGGSVLEYCASVPNISAGGTWTFTDATLDVNLNSQILIPPGGLHRNDPPPGSTGSVAPSTDKLGYLTYFRGRMWAIAGAKVYFTAGEDCQNGDPNASWPPANVFTFPGQPIALTPTSAGMLVWLNGCVKIIAGGPQTKAFFDDDLLDNFGISSPNCVSKDGDTIRVLTTQGQQFTLTVTEKVEDGTFVADLVASTFKPNTSYLTTHRNGLDSGVFLSDGSVNVLRYGLNIGAWSPMFKPVGGIKALKSIETSTGIHTLIAGRATGGGYILGRDLTTYQDDGNNYSSCFVTVGNLVLSEPGQPLVPVHYVLGYFAAVGTIPSVAVLPNEISGASGIGFITLPQSQNEPNTGAKSSTTLYAKQWEVRAMQTMQTSILWHHCQVKISFAQENFPNALKVLSLKHGEDD